VVVKGFHAEGVFGYLDFDIKFNQDVSFIVGGNGSGKTTALKLMNALVNPNFKELLQIPFCKCSLTLNIENSEVVISADTTEDNIVLSVSGCESSLILPNYSNSDDDYYPRREDKFEELIEDLKRKNIEHPVIIAISNIDSPIFLGLDRRRDVSNMKQDYFHEREAWMHKKRAKMGGARRFFRGSIGASLMDTEMLVQNSYRRIRELENRQSHKLRDKILLSSFQYSKFDEGDLTPDINKWKEKQGFLDRQKEIKEAISNIDSKDSSLSNEVDKFFSGITELFEVMEESAEDFSIEWLLNKAQIERMSSIVDIVDDHKSKIDKYYKPINDFLNTVNDFYRDSNKELKIDAVGQLVVKRPDGNECTIEGLSSGERQLLVIFAHAFFNHYSKRKNIFIIDEPELSLHLGWQEMFAETIFSISPNSQFILATHSPEIVAGNKNKAVKCR
jgi:predicted ATP-binding protein involved in virulence